jgi:hypothetical protein
VETEEMMAAMASSCCPGGTSHDNAYTAHAALRGVRTVQSAAHSRVHGMPGGREEGDDLLSHCTFDSARDTASKMAFNKAHARGMLQKALARLHHSLSTGKVGAVRQMHSFLRRDVSGESLTGQVDDVMPCETIWNPFCCAAEVCADMMVEMLDLMASGADWVTGMCEACIDEMGKLADDIVQTEENIVLMGYAIGDMSDCILVFIDQGLEFMTLFCPASSSRSTSYISLKGKFGVQSRGSVDEEGCSDASLLRLKNALVAVKSETLAVSTSSLPDTLAAWNQQEKISLKARAIVRQALDLAGHRQDNPFGEFAEMVDVMMRTMAVFTDMMASQTKLVTSMLDSLTHLAGEEVVLGGLVVDMGSEVAALGAEIATEEGAMETLTDCMEE